MNITDYILNDFKPLTSQSTVIDALNVFSMHPITHIPIVEKGSYIGCISQTDLLSIENKDQTLDKFLDIFEQFNTIGTDSTIELLKTFSENNTNIIPVVFEYNYVGYIELNDILEVFTQTPFIHSEGFILMIEKNYTDFSMSEVTQIIESNNGKLMGSYVSKMSTLSIELTLKIDSNEINEIIQTFRRYDYAIVNEHKDDIYLEELKNRADYLQKFLNT